MSKFKSSHLKILFIFILALFISGVTLSIHATTYFYVDPDWAGDEEKDATRAIKDPVRACD